MVGGSTTSEGTIEICHNRLWGLVTDAGWDPYDAEVVCRQLQLPTEGMKHVLIDCAYGLCHRCCSS